MMSNDHVMVTGAAGFIGSSLCDELVSQGRRVTGIDNFSLNYPEATKRENIRQLLDTKHFTLVECDVGSEQFSNLISSSRPDVIVHLAATPGVRPSVEHVLEYVDNNVRATANVLATAASAGVPKIIFASSSSVYGKGSARPDREDDPLVPLSPYAATKVAGEALCQSFAASRDISVTCLRFFTAYGPRQRPDMAICKLAHCIVSGRPFQMNGDGKSARDYTYISDIVSGICASISYEKRFDVFNLGSGNPIDLETMIKLTSEVLSKYPVLEQVDMPSCEPQQTCADVGKAATTLGYRPCVDFSTGMSSFAEWFVASQK
jgi:UDP-glucuronate 4-epimerase